MTSATPKPRAGEHVLSPAEQVIADHTAGIHAIIAERDLLRERERDLVEALEMVAHFLEPRGAIASLAPGSDASHLHRKLHALLSKHRR